MAVSFLDPSVAAPAHPDRGWHAPGGLTLHYAKGARAKVVTKTAKLPTLATQTKQQISALLTVISKQLTTIEGQLMQLQSTTAPKTTSGG